MKCGLGGGGAIKVAFVSNSPINIYLFRMSWIRALQQQGFEVTVIVPKGNYAAELQKEGVDIIHYYLQRKSLNPFKELRTIWQLFLIFKKYRFDLVHSFTIKPNIYSTLAARSAGTPHIVKHITGLGYFYTVRNLTTKLLRPFVTLLHRISCFAATQVVFQNNSDQKELGFPIKETKVTIIKGTGVDTDYFSSARVEQDKIKRIKNTFCIAKDNFVVTIVARLYWGKGLQEFIEAADIVHAKYPHVLFLVVGWIDSGNLDAVDEDWIKTVSKRPFVKFVGKQRDIREILYCTDVYVLPSYREGLPRTVLEAMSMEKPVITTDIPGNQELIVNNIHGILVPVGNGIVLANALKQLIEDQELRQGMGRSARIRVKEGFCNAVVVGQVLDLYKRLVSS